MKKILRLVTTSALALGLVACGEATNCPTCEVCEKCEDQGNYAAVSSIAIAADSSVLEQVTTALKKVTVTATLNSNVNPATEIEWYVDGAKSAQTSKAFEFQPTKAGEYKIQAKVGNVKSNEIAVKVTTSAGDLEIKSVEQLSKTQLEVLAPEGAVITVEGKTLMDSSYYDLVGGKYILTFKEAIVQGETVTVKAEANGKVATKSFTYDERKVTAAFSGDGTLDATTGVYTIVKPFADAGETTKNYEIDFDDDQDLIYGTYSAIPNGKIEYSLDVQYPDGTTKSLIESKYVVATTTGVANALSEAKTKASNKIKADTAAGTYVYTFKFGGKEVKATLVVSDPVKTLGAGITYAGKLYNPLATDNTVTKNADGSYTITRPFDTELEKELMLEFTGLNFAKPEYENNQYSISLTGPSAYGDNAALYSGIETAANGVADAANDDDLVSYVDFTTSNKTAFLKQVKQKITKDTPLGDYYFTVEAGTLADSTKYTVKVSVVAPTATLTAAIDSGSGVSADGRNQESNYDLNTNTYTVYKPLDPTISYSYGITYTLKNYNSPRATDEEIIAETVKAYEYNELAAFNGSLFNLTGDSGEALGALDTTTWDAQAFNGASNYSVGAFFVDDDKYYKVTTAITGGSNTIAGLLTAPAKIVAATEKEVTILKAWAAAKVDKAPATAAVTGDPIRKFSNYSYEATDKATVEKKLAIQLNTTNDIDTTFAMGTVLTVDSTTKAKTYTYKLTIDGMESVINLVVAEPTPKLFIMNTDKTTDETKQVLTATSDSTNKATVDDKENGIYYLDFETAKTDGFSAEIGIADLPAGTYNYHVTKEYPDANKNVDVKGSITVTASSANNDFVNIASDVTETQPGTIPFYHASKEYAWKIAETNMVVGTYKYTFTIGNYSKAITVHVGEYNKKLSPVDVYFQGTRLTKVNGTYVLLESDNSTEHKEATIKFKATNIADTELYYGGTYNSTTKALTGGTKLTAEDGIFTYTKTLSDEFGVKQVATAGTSEIGTKREVLEKFYTKSKNAITGADEYTEYSLSVYVIGADIQ